MIKVFDFILSIGAIVSLLVATYLFATDNNLTNSADELSLQKQQSGQEFSSSSSVLPDKTSSVQWEYIIIHHSSTKSGNARIFDRYHRKEKKMSDGLAYHFVIGNGTKSGNGEVEVGKRWHKKIPGPHCFDAEMNEESIGICLVGNFEKSKPTRAQISALVDLVKKLQKDYQIPTEHIMGHLDVDKGKTDCPGKHFPWKEIKSRLAKNKR